MKYLPLATLLIAVFILSGCFPGDATPYERAGFFRGLWHGLIGIFTLRYIRNGWFALDGKSHRAINL